MPVWLNADYLVMALAGDNSQALRSVRNQTHGAWRGILHGYAQLGPP